MILDTMVLAYGLLGVSKYRDEALRVIDRVPAILVPDLAIVELANAAWQWATSRGLDPHRARTGVSRAVALSEEIVPSRMLWPGALDLAFTRRHPVRDTVFATLAAQRGLRVVTYDRRMLRTFPEWTVHPADYLAETSPDDR